MIGIDVVVDPVSLKPAPSLRDGILNRLYTEGVLMFGAGESVLRIMPPLMIGEDLVRDALAVLDKVLTEVEQGL
jgi:4-aminobutyrate aminotransferase